MMLTIFERYLLELQHQRSFLAEPNVTLKALITSRRIDEQPSAARGFQTSLLDGIEATFADTAAQCMITLFQEFQIHGPM